MNDAVLLIWGVAAVAALALVKRTADAAGVALRGAQEVTSAAVGRTLQPAHEGWNPNDPSTDAALRAEIGITEPELIRYETEYAAGDDALEITWDDVSETQSDRAARQVQQSNPTFGKW